jgi:hypothetical protein
MQRKFLRENKELCLFCLLLLDWRNCELVFAFSFIACAEKENKEEIVSRDKFGCLNRFLIFRSTVPIVNNFEVTNL